MPLESIGPEFAQLLSIHIVKRFEAIHTQIRRIVQMHITVEDHPSRRITARHTAHGRRQRNHVHLWIVLAIQRVTWTDESQIGERKNVFAVAVMLEDARRTKAHRELAKRKVFHGFHLEVANVLPTFCPRSNVNGIVTGELTRVIIEGVVDEEESMVEWFLRVLQGCLVGIPTNVVEWSLVAVTEDAIAEFR